MGANLGVGGIVKGDCIECPFHQWKFRGVDGSCYEIPYSKSLTESKCVCLRSSKKFKIRQQISVEKSAKLKNWRCREVNNLIFVWYHAENEAPWEIPVVNEVQSGSWQFHGKNEFIVNCHIQDIPENGADVGEH